MTKILHFTDMHLRHNLPGTAKQPVRLSREMPNALDRLSDRIKEISPDVIVLSGDLLDVPDEVIAGASPDQRSLSEWINDTTADYQLIWEWFEATSLPYFVVPGNHDHNEAFSEAFGSSNQPRDIAGFRFFGFWDELTAKFEPIRTGSQEALFNEAMTSPEHDCPQIHVQHYMIHPPTVAKGKHYEYAGAADMKNVIERTQRVKAVLSGHYHPGSFETTRGIIHSLPPAFCEAPHAFRIYEIIEDRRNTISDHTLD
jgi:DNA repair exonuclease SbcCD nuclease subunit